ncbi:MAG TPA: (2Fe-2S)-binding protein [Bacteroidetes bacterium]|nr:(2Fe-2S)-binding protein [Bacteroidota bacterium]
MGDKPIEYEWHRVFEAATMGVKFLKDGAVTLVSVNGRKICMARKGETLFALRSRCPHSGGPLDQGYLNEAGELVCPWHRFRFCLEDGKSAGGEGYFVPHFPVQIREGNVFVGMEKRKRLFGLF